MDRDRIMELSRWGNIDLNVIREYCLEHNKDSELVEELLRALNFDLITLGIYYEIALEYFQRKYEIILIHDKHNNLITVY